MKISKKLAPWLWLLVGASISYGIQELRIQDSEHYRKNTAKRLNLLSAVYATSCISQQAFDEALAEMDLTVDRRDELDAANLYQLSTQIGFLGPYTKDQGFLSFFYDPASGCISLNLKENEQ